MPLDPVEHAKNEVERRASTTVLNEQVMELRKEVSEVKAMMNEFLLLGARITGLAEAAAGSLKLGVRALAAIALAACILALGHTAALGPMLHWVGKSVGL